MVDAGVASGRERVARDGIEQLRGYRLLEKIDDGPVGVVFRGIQPHVERDVAVKIFHEAVAADPAFVHDLFSAFYRSEVRRADAGDGVAADLVLDRRRGPARRPQLAQGGGTRRLRHVRQAIAGP